MGARPAAARDSDDDRAARRPARPASPGAHRRLRDRDRGDHGRLRLGRGADLRRQRDAAGLAVADHPGRPLRRRRATPPCCGRSARRSPRGTPSTDGPWSVRCRASASLEPGLPLVEEGLDALGRIGQLEVEHDVLLLDLHRLVDRQPPAAVDRRLDQPDRGGGTRGEAVRLPAPRPRRSRRRRPGRRGPRPAPRSALSRVASMMRRLARCGPISRGSRCEPPAPGKMPRSVSGKPNVARACRMRRSQASASSAPPPRACPLSAATTGLGASSSSRCTSTHRRIAR